MSATFATKYGPWALVAGASDGVGSAFAIGLAERGLNVVLLARRQAALDEVAAEIESRTSSQSRTLTIDLSQPDAGAAITAATADLEIGMLAYCAGADWNFGSFLNTPVDAAEQLIQRNCIVPVQLCHHYAPAMVRRGHGGIVIFGSGSALVGTANLATYSASKAFDMVFTEALWAELRDTGVDVLGNVLGKINTRTLRQLQVDRGESSSSDEALSGAASPESVVAETFANLDNGPTWMVGDNVRAHAGHLAAMSRKEAVEFMAEATARAMTEHH